MTLVSRTMFQRHKLEKAEGKAYNEPGVCVQDNRTDSELSRCFTGFVRDEGSELEVFSTARHQLAAQPVRQHCSYLPWPVGRYQGPREALRFSAVQQRCMHEAFYTFKHHQNTICLRGM